MNLKNKLISLFISICLAALVYLLLSIKKEGDYKTLVQQNMIHILAQQNYNSKAIFTDLINMTDNKEVIAIINLNRKKFAYWQIIRNKKDKTKNQQ